MPVVNNVTMQQPNDNSRSTPRYKIEFIDRTVRTMPFARAVNTPLEQSNMNMDMPGEKKEQRKRRKSPKSSTKASSDADTDRDTVRVPRSVLKEIIARARHLSSVLEDMLETSEQKQE